MTMSQKVVLSVVLLLTSATWGQAQAATVPVLDDFLATTQLSNSGDQTELDWISSLVEDTVTLLDKVEENTIDLTILEVTSDTVTYTIPIDPTTGFYIIKAGRDSYLFENLDELSSAYFTLDTTKDISHITTSALTTSDIPAVPLPAASWLFGTALLGLLGVARRYSKSM